MYKAWTEETVPLIFAPDEKQNMLLKKQYYIFLTLFDALSPHRPWHCPATARAVAVARSTAPESSSTSSEVQCAARNTGRDTGQQ